MAWGLLGCCTLNVRRGTRGWVRQGGPPPPHAVVRGGAFAARRARDQVVSRQLPIRGIARSPPQLSFPGGRRADAGRAYTLTPPSPAAADAHIPPSPPPPFLFDTAVGWWQCPPPRPPPAWRGFTTSLACRCQAPPLFHHKRGSCGPDRGRGGGGGRVHVRVPTAGGWCGCAAGAASLQQPKTVWPTRPTGAPAPGARRCRVPCRRR